MLRFVGRQANNIMRNSMISHTRSTPVIQNIRASHDEPQETDEEFNKRYIDYLNRTEIDHWEIRQVINTLSGIDGIPDPSIICAAFRACRRLNDYALTTRILEFVKDKCGSKANEVLPYIMQEIKPTMTELGISTLEELGYDKPELALQSVDDIH